MRTYSPSGRPRHRARAPRRPTTQTPSSSSPATAPTTRRSTAPTATSRSASCPAAGPASSPRARAAARPGRGGASVAGAIEGGRTAASARARQRPPLRFSAGIGFDAELVRRLDALGREAGGARPGDLAFLPTRRDHRRAARPLRAGAGDRGRWPRRVSSSRKCDPYSYAGPVPLRISRRARFDLGLDFAAPSRVRPLDVPRLAAYLCSGSDQLGRGVLHGHDLDRIVVRCDQPLPLQVDGEDIGDVDEALFEAERDAAPSSSNGQGGNLPRDGAVLPRLPTSGASSTARPSPTALGEHELLELYRSMVLLRTYDERSVVYHRQGRIGTYAIFWGHEAMQAGARSPSTTRTGSSRATASRRSACCAGMPASTILPGGAATRRAGGTRPTGTSPRSACRSRRRCRTPPASRGARAAGRATPSRSRSSATARPPRARSTRARTSPP